jgi:hypothetical protein
MYIFILFAAWLIILFVDSCSLSGTHIINIGTVQQRVIKNSLREIHVEIFHYYVPIFPYDKATGHL